MSRKQLTAVAEFLRLRMEKLSPERRSEIARNAAKVRWKKPKRKKEAAA